MHALALDLHLDGDRESIRRQTVLRAVEAVNELIAEHLAE
jgi:nicotinamide mononucleotide (NMN) deamidase PncC